MILTFTVRIEVRDDIGVKQAPYFKDLLNGISGQAGWVRSVVFEEWLSKPDSYYERIEMDALKKGEMEL